VKFTGQPGIDGVFSDLKNPKIEYDLDGYGRYAPVVDRESVVIHEVAEQLIHRGRVAGVAEYMRNPRLDGIVWAYREPLALSLTTHRVYFHTLKVAGSSAIERRWMRLRRFALVGHFRWPWLVSVRIAHAVSGEYVLTFSCVSASDRGTQRSLLLSFDSPDDRAQFVGVLLPVLHTELARRLDTAVGENKAKVAAARDSLDELLSSGSVSLPGFVPLGFLHDAEMRDPAIVQRVEKRLIPTSDQPLRTPS
jgi:hypothetical protein